MAETISTLLPANQLVVLSDAERKAVEHLRLTPEQREAQRSAQQQAQMARLPVEVKQAREAKAARLAGMNADQRRVYHLGQHLVAVVRMLRQETQRGVALADVVGAPDATEAEALTWFFDEVRKPRTTPAPAEPAPVDPAPGGGPGGRP
jgi:hypothetical protein